MRLNRSSSTYESRLAIFVLCACFIHSCGESALFLGGFPGISFMFVFYVLANAASQD